MEDENLASFQAITGADLAKAQQYLQLSDNSLDRAVDLFYSTGGVDLLNDTSAPATSTSGQRPRGDPEVINIDSDEETDQPRPQAGHSVEDDEAMARRLQEEMYGGGGGGSGSGGGGDASGGVDAEGYRAPIARTRETLVGGPGAGDYDLEDPMDRESAVLQQLRQREQARLSRSRRPGIFNQQANASIWNDAAGERQASSAAGSSAPRSDKATQLAEMYRPPFDLISPLDWDMARDEGKADQKWILVNIQDTSIFDCQVLNRDLWKDKEIRETIREHFIFLQYNKDDPAGDRYTNYYFKDREVQDAYPHVAIVDPRTGEQVKVWSGPPPPKPMEFLMQLHEFLDRYSLDIAAKNPVARRKPQERRESKFERMTEEEQLEWALKNSMEGASNNGNASGGLTAENDPDALTRSITDLRKQEPAAADTHMPDAAGEEVDESASAFKGISSANPHTEPDAGTPSTRIQFRHAGGRVVRKFAVTEPVRRIFEWLKAAPLDEHTSSDNFELVSMGKNLIENLDSSIEEAGLKNGTVMVEYTD